MEEGTINIRISSSNSYLIIEVEDEGPGIKQEDINNIFEPFYTSRIGGTGLGLAVCLKIIKLHDGEIFVDQDYKNGCRFIIKLKIQTK